MLFFHFLFYYSTATWWDYSAISIGDKIKNSYQKPILFLCYAHYCPHCHGLPEGLKKYSEGLGNRDDIYISMVDCAQSNCGRFKIIGTPTIYLIVGDKPRYWPVSPERGPEGWDRWVNQSMAPSLREIKTDKEFEQALEEPVGGGSVFYYQTSDENDPVLEDIKYFSRFFKLFNDTFVYKYDKSLKKKLTAHTSKHCSFVYKHSLQSKKNLAQFFDEYKFGIHHRYDTDEITLVGTNKKFGAILFTGEDLSDSQRDALSEISKEDCRAEYGWFKTDSDSLTTLRSFGASFDDLPFLLGVGKRAGKKLIYKGRVRNAWKSGFLQLIKNRASGNVMRSFVAKITVEDILAFLIVLLIVLLGILFYVIKDFCTIRKRLNQLNSKRVEV